MDKSTLKVTQVDKEKLIQRITGRNKKDVCLKQKAETLEGLKWIWLMESRAEIGSKSETSDALRTVRL